MSGSALWFLNRGSGVVLLAVVTLSTVLGVLSTARAGSRRWPRFLTQGLHRDVALLSVALTALHAGSAVLDEYVDIRWWQALVPFGATYRPLWLSLGTLASDVMLAAVVTSLLRHRMRVRAWRAVHVSTYLVFVLGVVHGLGIGTDRREPWSAAVTAGCLAAVVLAWTTRVVILRSAAAAGSAPVPSSTPVPR